jgi:hypothetical protein
MNTTRQRSNTLTPAGRLAWPAHEDLAEMQCQWESGSASNVDSPLGADGLEAFFHHTLGALDPEELEDLLHGD